MSAARLWPSLPGHLAWALATVAGTIAAVTAVYSYFYEGWGLGPAAAAGYLVPAVLVVGLGATAVRWPRAGGMLFLAGGAVAAGWWLARQAATDGLNAIVVQTAVVSFVPLLLIGALFLLGARHRRPQAVVGVAAPASWWRRNYRLALVVGVPILAVLAGPARQLPELLARHDDGLRGARTVVGNGVTLTWAPEGPGWNQRQADGAYLSREAIARYGGSGAGLCGHLSEDGTSLLPVPVREWRLPTADEVVRSLTRGGANAGCAWDGRASHADCTRPPDKETPLWAPDQPAIYYITSDEAGDQHVLGVNYTGGITPHRRTAGVGYRCVKAAPPVTR
jgi:hypothetical protein